MNAAKARSDKYATVNNEPTMTDQSGAAETDINLVVKRYGTFGTVPQGKELHYGDFADVPTDLAEAFRLMRQVPELKKSLPEALANLTVEEIVDLPLNELQKILTPPAPTPAPTGEPK